MTTKFEVFDCGIEVMQDASLYCLTSDSILLADFIKVKKTDRVLEIGTGCGVISLVVNQKQKPAEMVAFECQPCLASLALQNAMHNRMPNLLVVEDKIQNWKSHFPAENFDVVFSNPPYTKQKSGETKASDCQTIARHEVCLTHAELCQCAAANLKFGGKFFVMSDSQRLAEMMFLLTKNNLIPKHLLLIDGGKKLNIFLLEAVKGGKHGLKVEIKKRCI